MFSAPVVKRIVSLIAALALAFCASACGGAPASSPDRYCAILSDSVGLYLNNPVTQMGFTIGSVRAIEARDTEVKVEFVIDEERPMPSDVRAVVRSPSILADRSLELVGNYEGGPQLTAGECIPLNRSFTPLSISRVIGSATDFVNAINPGGSENVKDALAGIEEALTGTGEDAKQLLTRSSTLLDSPDQAIADLGAITRNMAELTSMIRENREPVKHIVEALPGTTPDIVQVVAGAKDLTHPLPEIVGLANDLELELGTEIQLALDAVTEAVRILSPHYKGVANVLNPLPRFISGLNGEPAGAQEGGLAKRINNHVFNLLPYRPPLYRIPTSDGLFACGMMNASAPGSCADINGRPYAVDVALLQYVLTEAARR